MELLSLELLSENRLQVGTKIRVQQKANLDRN